LGADNSVFAVIRTLQHKPRLSNRCVGQTLTFGASGWAAQEIWKRVSDKPEAYYGGKDVAAPFKVLGQAGRSDDEYLKAIFDMLRELGR